MVASARREALLDEVIAECRQYTPESCYIAGDISEQTFAESLVSETVTRFGRIDILINNAAVPLRRALYNISVEEAEAVMGTNFLSCLWTTYTAIPAMLLQGEHNDEAGYIVNVSSFAATVTPTHETIYAASKGAMNGFAQGLWNDLSGSGIHCILVVPGPIETEIWEKFEDKGAYNGKKYPATSWLPMKFSQPFASVAMKSLCRGEIHSWSALACLLHFFLRSSVRVWHV